VSQDGPSGSAGDDDLDAARRALVGRREAALLDEPSVEAVARMLARRVREPAVWVRAAVTTLERFRREVAEGDLPGLLRRRTSRPSVAEQSLRRLAARHDGLTGGSSPRSSSARGCGGPSGACRCRGDRCRPRGGAPAARP
jgi:hypothetical protein